MSSKLASAISRRLPRRRGASDRSSALGQIESLTDENRRERNPGREVRLVKLRNEAFAELDRDRPDTAPEMLERAPLDTPAYEVVDHLPTVAAAELGPELIRAAFLDAGCLLVRGLLDRGSVESLKAGIDRAFEGRDAYLDGKKASETTPWFRPFVPAERYQVSDKAFNRHVKGSGSVWAVDSPRMMFELLETFEAAGLLDLATGYLGERPAFSMKKSVLRRVEADSGAAWHQDGAFLGDGIRTINFWIALNRCGDTAPGMDIVARRLTEIVPTGTEDALFEWAVSDQLVSELPDAPVARPIFEPGDALLFDHLCLHRTAADPQMPKQRYATETWCFAPSSYPEAQIPIVV
ncbi:MAG: phytanoyl-CoA dioxygenase family protein [Solirubrobacterales bacterium]